MFLVHKNTYVILWTKVLLPGVTAIIPRIPN